jgi:hypothetical protein
MPSVPLLNPAPYAPPFAMSFANAGGTTDVVSSTNPLPVTSAAATSPTPLAGTTSATGVLGPFIPVPGRPVMLSLSGTWAGTVKITRSTDGGTTRLPLTAMGQAYGSFTANMCEPVFPPARFPPQAVVARL